MVSVDDKEIKKAKVFNKNIIYNIRYKEYVYVLLGRGLMRHSMKGTQSKILHRIGNYDVCKISLSFLDDTLYDGVNSLAYFH